MSFDVQDSRATAVTHVPSSSAVSRLAAKHFRNTWTPICCGFLRATWTKRRTAGSAPRWWIRPLRIPANRKKRTGFGPHYVL